MRGENQNINNEPNQIENKQNTKSVLKLVLIILAVFFGTFAAVYTIVDMSMYRLGLKPFFTIAKEFDKVLNNEMKDIEQSTPVKIEIKDNAYVVTVDLKSFGNNPENTEVTIENNSIKIEGKYKQDKEYSVKENSFYQNVIFPNKINADNVQKEIKRNKMIITIPLEY